MGHSALDTAVFDQHLVKVDRVALQVFRKVEFYFNFFRDVLKLRPVLLLRYPWWRVVEMVKLLIQERFRSAHIFCVQFTSFLNLLLLIMMGADQQLVYFF